jgi:iron complex outermembrane receptor protein
LNLFLAAGQINILIPGSLTLNQMRTNPRQANATAVARNANRYDDRFRLGIQFRREFSQYLEGAVTTYWDYRQMEHIPVFQFIEMSRIAAGEDVRLTYSRPVLGFANKLILGSSYQFQFTRENNYAVLNGGRGNLVADEDQDQSHFGVYVQDQFFVSDTVSITGGVRYSRFEFKLEDHFFSDGNQSDQIDFDKFTYQIGSSWTPIPEANLFANFSTAFQTPTLQEVTSGPSGGFIGLKPENVINYEAGVRGNFILFGMPAAYEATYFRMEFQDKILPRTVGFTTIFENAGDTLHEGVSAGLSLDITRSLNAQVSYTYSDFRFTAGQFDGRKVPGQTPHQILSALYYKFFLPRKATLTLGAEHRYSDDYFVNDTNTFTNPNWQTLTLKANYQQGPFGAQLVVDNVTDEVYSDAVSINNSLGQFFNPADGFSVIGSVSWRY